MNISKSSYEKMFWIRRNRGRKFLFSKTSYWKTLNNIFQLNLSSSNIRKTFRSSPEKKSVSVASSEDGHLRKFDGGGKTGNFRPVERSLATTRSWPFEMPFQTMKTSTFVRGKTQSDPCRLCPMCKFIVSISFWKTNINCFKKGSLPKTQQLVTYCTASFLKIIPTLKT